MIKGGAARQKPVHASSWEALLTRSNLSLRNLPNIHPKLFLCSHHFFVKKTDVS